MNAPDNYKILKLTSARRYLLKMVTSLQEIDDETSDDRLIFEFLNLADRIQEHITSIKGGKNG